MRRTILLTFLAAACTPTEELQVFKADGAGHKLAHVIELDPENPLRSYSWDGGSAIPVSRTSGQLEIEFGERGSDERTRLYRSFDDGASHGRFGRAHAIEWGSQLRFEGTDLFAPPFVLSFWIRPKEKSAGKTIFDAGPLQVHLNPDGSCRARLDVVPPLSLRAGKLRFGKWNHVAVAFDRPELDQLRLIVNDEFAIGRIKADFEFAEDQALVVGDKLIGALDDLSLRGHATSTADLIDRGTKRARPGEHRLTLNFENGTQELSLWAGALTFPQVQGIAWQAGELRHAMHEDGALRRVPGHWDRIPAKDPPLARTTHPTVYVGDNQVFLFGGETRDTHGWVWKNTDDTWIFHTKEGRWEHVPTEAQPPPSCHQPAAYSPDHGIVLYPGGWRNDVEPSIKYDEVWVFHPKERRWENRTPTGFKFPKLTNCGLTYHAGFERFFLFTSGQKRAFVYEPGKDAWSQRPPYVALNEAGEEVEYATNGSPMTAYDPGSGKIVLFGGGREGEEGRIFFDTTALYDPAANTFTVLDMDRAPSPRVRSGFAYDSKRAYFVLYGGVQDAASQRNDDLWILDPAKKEWREMAASNSPGERGGYYAMAYDPDLDRFFLLCGRAAQMRFLDEAWSLSLDDGAVGEATYVFDRAGFAEREWYLEATTPGDARVECAFRTTDEPGAWSAWFHGAESLGEARYVQARLRLSRGANGEEPVVVGLGFR